MSANNKIVFITLTLAVIVSLFFYERYYVTQPVLYPDFGITIPAGYTTHGIDVSRYQRKINWDEVVQMRDKGQRISFAFVKCTEGTTIIDPFYKKNWEQLKEKRLLRGCYLYFHPNKKAKQQAEFFIKHADLVTGDLPPVIDIEETHGMNAQKIQASLKECIDILEAHYHAKPIIYTGADFYEHHLQHQFDSYPLWVAHYEQPSAPRIQRDWLIWQHNCKGRVNGIRGEVDFNVVNGNLTLLQSLCL
ncbi:MAG: glycoside hydrolase family 25 protein [Bacteroidetes bacterium]|jgi:lysozyme|nr:glycoside hydrolase family 25 protein [Bacteroidota bacterium]MBK6819272.1 glycoside hydrolase family 25 protein [Bacteroidota bacterium]MBK8330093.1 glycoside hydrolase family 25 protein [Bacteroidota bacterium]MBK9301177.1 glycoside hydrolase family 25 protein [Bacteroidota bacterium]HQW46751.1 GH25 family lysozyme [Chitinophagaceae bacterium]